MFFRKASEPEAQPEWLIVGLGNPGMQYSNTRHNVGQRLARMFAKEHDIRLEKRRFRSLFGSGMVGEIPVVIALPMTFMNLSGDAVSTLMRHFDLKPDRLLVLADELNLPTGKIRIRTKGSAGGQKGLENIIARLRTEEFGRLRIGIDRPGPGLESDYVLSPFSRDEMEAIESALRTATQAIELYISEGPERTMNEFNR
jgi:PTH1 family peptidyl-tRNA hydrolase